ncbi:MAG TPA: hypothetical protein VEZ12_19025 [Herpetosiphonaceae bacterium]|nr:hypothetical protein [Herpetosiphonaceae bacterium]
MPRVYTRATMPAGWAEGVSTTMPSARPGTDPRGCQRGGVACAHRILAERNMLLARALLHEAA